MIWAFKKYLVNFRQDLPAGIVVFFVALPLCLGIALASGAPLFAGIISGIVGGVVVGGASGSKVGVSGPAAGLAVVVLNALATLKGWDAFLVAVLLAGTIQIVMGHLKLGLIAYYFPTSVIKGMLTGIGLIIILKQIPHALGYDRDFEGDVAFETGGENTFSFIENALELATPGALIISGISLTILLLWENILSKKHKVFSFIQGPIVCVVVGILLKILFDAKILPFTLDRDHLVNIPVPSSMGEFFQQFTLPDFSYLFKPEIYPIALTLAVVASLETLLCVEATDKLDPNKSITPVNRELWAQGLGNILSGLIGGLPITQVIVRSTANITFGAMSKLSTILHGIFLFVCALAIPSVLNLVPLATLACILFVVGYKLAKPSLFVAMYRLGWHQFIPFIVTTLGIVFTDLLKGIGIGMAVAIFFLLRNHFRNAYSLERVSSKQNGKSPVRMLLAEETSFLNKGSIMKTLNELEDGSQITIDATKSKIIDHDVIEVIRDFTINAKRRNISVKVIGIPTMGRDTRYQEITEGVK